MRKIVPTKKRKMPAQNQTQAEHKLRFSVSQDGTKYYYQTKSGVWRNISDINPYGLRYIMARLEKEGHQHWDIYDIISREYQSRQVGDSLRQSQQS